MVRCRLRVNCKKVQLSLKGLILGGLSLDQLRCGVGSVSSSRCHLPIHSVIVHSSDSPKIQTPRMVRDSGMFESDVVGPSRSRGCLTHSCSGVQVALPTLGSSKPELDEGVVSLCTGIVLDAETLVDRAGSTPDSSGALASRRLPGVLGAGLQTPGCMSFSFRPGLVSHTS